MGSSGARFITIEGSDGSGKSTLLARIEEDLKTRSFPYEITREPGGSPVAEEIREIILKPGRKLDARAELLLFEAARAEHVATRIRPALDSGRHVLCDRFTHSSLAYQGIARGLGEELVGRLNAFATDGLEPDAVIWLKLDPSAARARVEGRGETLSRIDAEAEAFHRKVFSAFETMAKREPARFIVLDAGASPDAVFQELLGNRIWQSLFARGAK
jgi:dTMP kinase